MNLVAHQLAQRGVDHAVTGQRQLAAKGLGDHERLEMDPIVPLDVDAGAGQALFDQLADDVGIHGGVGGPGRKIAILSQATPYGPMANASAPLSMPSAHSARSVSDQALSASGRRVFDIEREGLAAVAARIGGDADDRSFSAACRAMLACAGRVVCMGMGKSGHVARKIAATLASTGTPAFYVHPGEAGHGDLGMITDRDVVLALSYSGESDEIAMLLPVLKRQGNVLIAMTGRPQSTLAREADLHLDVSVPTEACPLALAPTASTTASLAMGDALAVALLEARGFTSDDFARSHPAGALGRRLLLHIADVMHAGDDIPQVGAEATLSDALLEMSRKRLGMTAVVDAEGKLLGLYTDGDLRRTLADPATDVHATHIDQVMTRTPITIDADALAVEAAQLMETHKINALLVIDSERRVVGALNIHDLLRARVV
jgi:arabinose-5-phosphate isomerase